MIQNITFKDIEKYPLLYDEAIAYLKDVFVDTDISGKDIATGMKGWNLHRFGRGFWYKVSCGMYAAACIDYPELAYLFEDQIDKKSFIIRNNGFYK